MAMDDMDNVETKPLVAIVGRPNVGKSSLFNKIAGRRIAVVDDVPGVTRDRLYTLADWVGRDFHLADTGGIMPEGGDPIASLMREHTLFAVETATVVVMVADITAGVTGADFEVAEILKKTGKPVILAVNKMDSIGPENPDIYEFYKLGLGDPIAVSALHGHGTGDLLDACVKLFPPRKKAPVLDWGAIWSEEPLENPDAGGDAGSGIISVAVIGKPNAGKSSLVNKILGEDRVIVGQEGGTTRDAVDTPFENGYGKYVFIDTAGIRRNSNVSGKTEKFSIMRAELAIERADVCIVVLDARDGVTEQDTKVAGLAHKAGKPSVIVMNKWDLVEKETGTLERMHQEVKGALSYMSYAPILFISALTGQRVDKLFGFINGCYEEASRRFTTGMLNDLLADAMARVEPPADRGRRLKIYYMTQTSVRPPTFVCFCNDTELFHFSYRRYLENQIRAAYGLKWTPLRIVIRRRKDG
jgi:GTP-binding protein